MPHPAPATRMAAGAALLLFLLVLLPGAALAQDPPVDPRPQAFAFALTCNPSFVEVAYMGQATVPCIFIDASRDTSAAPGTGGGFSVTPHTTTIELIATEPSDAQGWQLLITNPFIASFGGTQQPVSMNIMTTPQINVARVTFHILATFSAPGGYVQTQNVTISSQIMPYDFGYAEIVGKIKKVGQDQDVSYVVQVTNLGVYPDVYDFVVRSQDPSFIVTAPPGLYVPPLSTRNVTIMVNTPNDKLYEFGKNNIIFVRVVSTTGKGVYDTTGIMQMRGGYLPVHWVPLLIVGLVSASIVTRGARERAQLRRLEKGRPRRIQPTPRQAVLLAELKRKDPDAYRQRKAGLDAIYKERRKTFLVAWRERKTADRAEARQARKEFKEARKKRKAEEKARRTRETREKKERKIRERAEAKLRKKKEKELAKARKKLEKRKKKLDKKQAKIDAKQAKRDAKAQAKADKLARKQAKADAKAARKRGGNP